jgi:hypothetical protein
MSRRIISLFLLVLLISATGLAVDDESDLQKATDEKCQGKNESTACQMRNKLKVMSNKLFET